MAAVAVAAHELIDGLSWAAAFVLGAVVAPTDPIAAQATFSRMHVPERVGLLVEGEAMLNDASGAGGVPGGARRADGGHVQRLRRGGGLRRLRRVAASPSAWPPAGSLVTVTAQARRPPARRSCSRCCSPTPPTCRRGGARLRRAGRRLGGLYLGWHSHDAFSADTRLSATAFWEVLVFGLNALLFLLLGMQFPAIARRGARRATRSRRCSATALAVDRGGGPRAAGRACSCRGWGSATAGASGWRSCGAACAARSRWPRRCRCRRRSTASRRSCSSPSS